MTANEDRLCPVHGIPDCSPMLNACSRLTSPDTSPTPVDGFDAADDLVTASLRDYMATLPGQNWSAEDAPDLALHVVNELDDKGLLRSRASIGPDSERIRELEAENRIAVGQLEHVTNLLSIERDRAAGLLPGPDDIVVSREIAFCGNEEPHVKHGWGQEGVLRLRLCLGRDDGEAPA